MKKILLLTLLLGSSSAFAQGYFIEKCTDPAGGIIQCKMGSTPGTSYNSKPNPQFQLPQMAVPGAAAAAGVGAALAAPAVQTPDGYYTNKVPGGNVFAFCSGGRPSRHSSKRPVYDFICPKGKAQ